MDNKISLLIDGKTLRERILLFSVITVISSLAWLELLFTPFSEKQQTLTKEIQITKTEITTSKLVIKGLTDILSTKTVSSTKESLINNSQQLENLKKTIKDKTAKVISANQMIKVIRDILEKNTGLTLVAIENEKAELITDKTNKAVTEKEDELTLENVNKIYKHSVIVKLNGSYTSLVEYLETLEVLKWKFIWTAIKIETDSYPNNDIELTISTLSLDKSLLEF